MNVCPVLKSFPQIGNIAFARQFEQGRSIRGQVRRAVGERNTGFERGVGVDLARSDLRIVLHQAALEILQRLVHGAGPVEHFGGSAPDHHQARDVIRGLRNCSMSSMSICALSILEPLVSRSGPLMRRIYSGSNTAFIGRMADSGSFNWSS